MDVETVLQRHSRVRLLDGPTPIQPQSRIEETLETAARGISLYVKPDDLMALGGGGNKLRKLEFLLGAVVDDGADTIITVGGRQSNHARPPDCGGCGAPRASM